MFIWLPTSVSAKAQEHAPGCWPGDDSSGTTEAEPGNKSSTANGIRCWGSELGANAGTDRSRRHGRHIGGRRWPPSATGARGPTRARGRRWRRELAGSMAPTGAPSQRRSPDAPLAWWATRSGAALSILLVL